MEDYLNSLKTEIYKPRADRRIAKIIFALEAYLKNLETDNPDRILNLALLVIIGIVMVVGIGFSVNFL